MEDKTARILDELISAIKDVAPEIWAIVIRQVQVEAYQLVGLSIFVFMLSGIFVYIGNRNNDGTNKGEPEVVMPIIISAFVFFAAIGFLIAAISRFCNPEYYAIKLLLDILP